MTAPADPRTLTVVQVARPDPAAHPGGHREWLLQGVA